MRPRLRSERHLTRIAAVLTTVILAAEPANAFSSQVISIGLTAGDVEDALLVCPEGSAVLGGGFDPQDASLVGFELLDSSHSLLPEEGWHFEMRDATGLAGARLARGAAICGYVPDRSLVYREEFSGVPFFGIPPTPGSPRAECPAGTVAIGGGVQFGDVQDPSFGAGPPEPPQVRRLLGLSPVIFQPQVGERLLGAIDEGTYDAPYAYEVSGIAYSAFQIILPPNPPDYEAGGIRVTALCARLTKSEVQMVVSQGVAPAMGIASEAARCPDGFAALGGGVAAEPDLVDHEIVSSAPLYSGFPFPRRLWSLDDGQAGAPIGWRGAIHNDGAGELPFNVAAICVPEPEGWLAAIGAFAALLARAGAAGAGRGSLPSRDDTNGIEPIVPR